VKDIVSKMRLAVSALENLFNSLLDISKLDSGVLQPQVEEVPLAVLFQRIENDHRPEAEDKGLEFVVEDCGGVMVRSDSILLERVLRNFVTNAIRYTEQGRVTLSCQVQDGEVIVRVADTGIGIWGWPSWPAFRVCWGTESKWNRTPARDRSSRSMCRCASDASGPGSRRSNCPSFSRICRRCGC